MREAGLSQSRADAAEIELDDNFWSAAELVVPGETSKASVHLRVDSDVLDWFRSQGKGHLTRMNAVLRAYYEANKGRPR
ncbi:MAG: BrnA antitoxin family protein [Bacteroidales bacterium]|nr:BrnA antitoxin family protein [Bacteroidales bacterium]